MNRGKPEVASGLGISVVIRFTHSPRAEAKAKNRPKNILRKQ